MGMKRCFRITWREFDFWDVYRVVTTQGGSCNRGGATDGDSVRGKHWSFWLMKRARGTMTVRGKLFQLFPTTDSFFWKYPARPVRGNRHPRFMYVRLTSNSPKVVDFVGRKYDFANFDDWSVTNGKIATRTSSTENHLTRTTEGTARNRTIEQRDWKQRERKRGKEKKETFSSSVPFPSSELFPAVSFDFDRSWSLLAPVVFPFLRWKIRFRWPRSGGKNKTTREMEKRRASTHSSSSSSPSPCIINQRRIIITRNLEKGRGRGLQRATSREIPATEYARSREPKINDERIARGGWGHVRPGSVQSS